MFLQTPERRKIKTVLVVSVLLHAVAGFALVAYSFLETDALAYPPIAHHDPYFVREPYVEPTISVQIISNRRSGGGTSHSATNSTPVTSNEDPYIPNFQNTISPGLLESGSNPGPSDPTVLAGSDVGGGGSGNGPGNGSGLDVGPGTDVVYPIGEVIAPVLVHRVEPDYPELARKLRIQGVEILSAVIGKDGSIEELETLRTTHPLLNQAARIGVKQWRYQPATFRGKTVRCRINVTVKFTLQ